MSDEHDSWFNNTFGIDLSGAAKRIEDEARAAKAQVTNIVQTVQKKVDGVIDDVVNTATGVVKKVAEVAGGGNAGGGSAKPPAKSGGGTGSFPLSGSVGRGGQNAPNDVKAVQRALGISDDGQCGSGTIAAIENFQRSIGQAKPDGRVDPGGATERALAGGGKGAAGPKSASEEDGSDDLLGKALSGAKSLAGELGDLAGGLPGKAIELGKDLAGGLAGQLAGGLGGDLPGGGTGVEADLSNAFSAKSPTKEGLIKEINDLNATYDNKLKAAFTKSLEELKQYEQDAKGLPAFSEQLIRGKSPSNGLVLAALIRSFASFEQALKSERTKAAFDARKAKFLGDLDRAGPVLRDHEANIQQWSDKLEQLRRKAADLEGQANSLQSALNQLSDTSHGLNDRIVKYNNSIAAKVHGKLDLVIIKDLGLGDNHRLVLFETKKILDTNAKDLADEKSDAAGFDKDLKESSEKLPPLKFVAKPGKKKK